METFTVEHFFPKKIDKNSSESDLEEVRESQTDNIAQMFLITDLPEEIILKIFAKIDFRHLISSVAKTCRTFYNIICSEGSWKSILGIKFPDFQEFKPSENDVYLSSWREAACSYDDALTLRSYSLQSDKIHTSKLCRHYAPVDSVNIVPGGKLCISGARDRTIAIWDTRTHQCVQSLAAHKGWVWALKSNENESNQFASASWDRTVKLWDLNRNGREDEMLIDTYNYHPAAIISMSFKNNLIVTGCYDKKVRLFDTRSNAVVQTISQHKRSVLSILELSDNILLSGSEDKTIGVYDKRACKTLTNVSVGTQVLALNSSKENGFNYLHASGFLGSLYIYNINHERFLLLNSFQLWKKASKATSLASYRGSIVVGSEDGTVRFYSPGRETKMLLSASMHTSAVVEIDVRDGIMATASNDLTIGLTQINSS